MVSQDTYLFSESLRENIRIGNTEAIPAEVISAAKAANIHELIDSLPEKYDTRVGELGRMLSSDEAQRIALARVLLKDSQVILLDEPTSNLDALNEEQIMETIKHIFNEKTVVLISHRPSAFIHADTIYVLDRGKITEQGSYDSLLSARGALWEILRHEHTT